LATQNPDFSSVRAPIGFIGDSKPRFFLRTSANRLYWRLKTPIFLSLGRQSDLLATQNPDFSLARAPIGFIGDSKPRFFFRTGANRLYHATTILFNFSKIGLIEKVH
jgi:hypothetical protein